MGELVFVKLGGSLITDKRIAWRARRRVIRRLAQEVRRALDASSDLSLVLGHGSGSFGHVVASRYHVQRGCSDWRGYAETGAAAQRLNRIVTDEFLDAGVPAVSIQPSASASCRGGELLSMVTQPVQEAIRHALVPLVYGDVALDDLWGTTIVSTETIFVYLARELIPGRIILVGEVGGVYSADPHLDPKARLISVLHAQDPSAQAGLGGAYAVDVTGGMRSKVELMADLLHDLPDLRVHLISGQTPGLVQRVLANPDLRAGTLLVL